MKKKMLLAVSGGPDSMFLLEWYKKKNIVVAHVNYHKREDSNNDENIVREFCSKHNIPFEVFNVNTKHSGNFQDWARKVRYDFFKEVYLKHDCEVLVTAHHKDDFVETAWMQMKSGRTPAYFGIKEKITFNDMNIYRPFVGLYWKEEILKKINKKEITFATDYTNEMPIYERNKVRLEFAELPLKEKQNRFEWFVMSNKILVKKTKRIDREYDKWLNSNFDLNYFRGLNKYKEDLIFKHVHTIFDNNKVSSSKVEGLVQFIEGKEGSKKYYVSKHEWFKKEKGFLINGKDC